MTRRVVWKYQLALGSTVVTMPHDSDVLTVAEQHGAVCLWALVDRDAPMVQRTFRVVATGEPFDAADLVFTGTVLMQGGAFVVHVFEVWP